MGVRKYRYFVGDFETTVFKGQTFTEVWASAIVELFTEDVQIYHSIDETFDALVKMKTNVMIYYHNLKFDGSFWLDFLIHKKDFKQAYEVLDEISGEVKWLDDNEMPNKSFKYGISNRGQWYTITIKINGKYIEIRDSLKLLPFSVKRIGESVKTKHKKLDMEYEGIRWAGCDITEEEKRYIANDVLVIKEAVEIMFTQGHKRMTIGSCCLAEFKRTVDMEEYRIFFPNIYDIEIDEKKYGKPNAGAYILKSYRGGWCYAVPEKTNKIVTNGITYDVNSLYPSMMHSESGNYYPIGKPTFWTGDIPKHITWKRDDRNPYYYFVRFRTRFYLKKGKLPFIQIKNNWLYKATECLTTSDIWDRKTKTYRREYLSFDGEIKQAIVELTMTCTDFELFKEHYMLTDFEMLDGCYFDTEKGIFDEYINKYKEIKQTSQGAVRELAKLFLNNLYGKMASSTCSSFKVAYSKEDKSLGFYDVTENDKEPGYIPIGSAITSYARNFTIRAAQMNYHGKNKPGFCYADTDSIHCDLPPEKIVGVKLHPTNFCCWAPEAYWDYAIFARQKTYIEHITHKNTKKIETPEIDVKCAGMPERCKKMFVASVTQEYDNEWFDKLEEEEKIFVKTKREITDFKIGLIVPGKLVPRRITGGVLLTPTTYEMR